MSKEILFDFNFKAKDTVLDARTVPDFVGKILNYRCEAPNLSGLVIQEIRVGNMSQKIRPGVEGFGAYENVPASAEKTEVLQPTTFDKNFLVRVIVFSKTFLGNLRVVLECEDESEVTKEPAAEETPPKEEMN